MSFTEQRSRLETIFKNEWVTGPAARSPMAWDNVVFNEPAPSLGSSWVRLSIRNGDTIPASLGTKFSRTPGILYLQIFVPKNTGMVLSRQHGDFFREMMRHRRVPLTNGTIQFEETSFQITGETGSWHQSIAIAPFRQDEYSGQAINFMTALWMPNLTTLTGGADTSLDHLIIANLPNGTRIDTYADDPEGGTGQRFRSHILQAKVAESQASPNVIISDRDDDRIFVLLQ